MKSMKSEPQEEKNLALFSGKTFQECSTQKTTHSGVSWASLLEQTLPLRPTQADSRVRVMLPVPSAKRRGECLTLNISECPNDAVASSLSQVLEGGCSIQPKYYLSKRACEGILRRAENRGKQLPEVLKLALEAAVAEALPCSVKDPLVVSTRVRRGGTIKATGGCLGGGSESLVVDKIYDMTHADKVVVEHENVVPPLMARMGTGGNQVPLVLMDQGGSVMNVDFDKVGTLRAQTHGHEPIVCTRVPLVMSNKATPFRISSYESNAMKSPNPHSGVFETQLSPTLDTTTPTPAKAQGGLALVQGTVVKKTGEDKSFCLAENMIGRSLTAGCNGIGVLEDKSYTLNATGVHGVAHCFKIRSGCEGGGKGYLGQDEKTFTIATHQDQQLFVANRVRKLTPIECERLQGFPDNWTRIPYRGKTAEDCPDSPRYKAIGNSWAVPCVRWIGERIDDMLEKEKKKKMKEVKHSKYDLIQMQSLPLEQKVIMSRNRIRAWYEHWDGDVYLSFSGGKDSTVLKHIIDSMNLGIPSVYVNTGLEYPEVRSFALKQANVTRIDPKMKFYEVIEKYGYPVASKEQSQFLHEIRTTKSQKLLDIRLNGNKYGQGKVAKRWRFLLDAPFKISHKCCDVMKKNPARAYEKETGRKAFVGTRAEESSLRVQTWLRFGCNAFTKKRPVSQPLAFWTEQDVLEYIVLNNIELAPVYGEVVRGEDGKLKTTGVDRTGCMFCMFGVDCDEEPNRFQRMAHTHPKQYEYCIHKLGLGEVLDFLKVKY